MHLLSALSNYYFYIIYTPTTHRYRVELK